MAPANTPAAGSGTNHRNWIGVDLAHKEAAHRLSALDENTRYHLSQLSAFDRPVAPARSFTFLGWRVSLQRVQQQPEPCPQCGGRGMWRPPYQSRLVACDLCTKEGGAA